MTRLTERETQVMHGLCDGLTNKEIGEMLGISSRTVEIHRLAAIRALGGKNSTHAAIMFHKERNL